MLYLFDRMDSVAEAELSSFARRVPPEKRGGKLQILAYSLLRWALEEEYGIKEWPPIAYGPHGKPYFVGGEGPFFSLSHCPAGVLCALGDGELGADIQDIARGKKRPALWGRVCSPGERLALAAAEDPGTLFARFWSLKESYSKYTGEGLGGAPQRFCFAGFAEGAHFTREGLNFSVWEKEGYVVSVCARDIIPGLFPLTHIP